MDFTTMKTAVQEDGGFPTSDATTRIPQWLNATYNDLLSRRGWGSLELTHAAVALVAGTTTYNLTGAAPVVTDFGSIIDVSLEITASGARRKLPWMDAQEFDDLLGHARVNSVPIAYTIAGGAGVTTPANVVSGGLQQLILGPPPVATAGNGVNVFIRYFRNPASIQLTNNSDVPILPVQLHDLVVMGAVARGLRATDRHGEAKGFEDRYEYRVQQAVAEDERNRPIRDQPRITFQRAPEPDARFVGQSAAAHTYPVGEGR